MKATILSHLDHPEQLECLYRENKSGFSQTFQSLYPEIAGHPTAECWQARLNYENRGVQWGTSNDLVFVIFASLLAGFLAKLPAIFGWEEEFFYPRNIGFIVFPVLMGYFIWKNELKQGKLLLLLGATLAGLIFINLLPNVDNSDTLVLSCVHLPLFLWAVWGFSFVGDNPSSSERRMDFLRYNGDFVVLITLILIAGMILTGMTLGLFELIGFGIENFYIEWIVVFGLAAAPIVATYVLQTNPHLVSNVSPVIARIFSPLVLITLMVYLTAMLFSGKDPYNDREFLLTFNLLLIGVMAIIVFSLAEALKSEKNGASNIILLALALVTIIVNGIALSAILFRISEWGITPNRLAVLGGNLLILANLVVATNQLFRAVSGKADMKEVERGIAFFLPIYSLWTVVVVFLFPLLFGFQ